METSAHVYMYMIRMLLYNNRIWPCAASLAINAISSFMVFPFFTYLKSDGWLGAQLPKILFFVKINIDIVGRSLPNAPRLVLRSGRALLAIALFKVSVGGETKKRDSDAHSSDKVASSLSLHADLLVCMCTCMHIYTQAVLEGAFFMYLFLCPPSRLTDLGVCAFVGVFWLLAGFISTTSYMLASRKAERKAPEGSVPVRMGLHVQNGFLFARFREMTTRLHINKF